MAAGGTTVDGKPRESIPAAIVMSGAVSAGITVLTNPLDCLRVRWQVLPHARARETAGGLVGFAREIVAREGFAAGLWRPGLGANMLAVFNCTGIRIGIYPTVRDALLAATGSRGAAERDGATMAAAGLLSGALSFFVATPFFQAKTRLQAEAGAPRRAYRGMAHFFASCARNEGPAALLRGADALVLRGSLLSMGHLAGYDGAKTWAKRRGVLSEGPVLHASASLAGALLAATLASPGDRVMTEYQTAADRRVSYRSAVHCARALAQTEGALAFWRGWWPLFLRIGPTFAGFGVGYEALRALAGLDAFGS
ncbi:hypothetical protein KFE25_002362 [Diacronema lutheri]|uniref:Mitochondrial carrier protein n=1 Tax=Diacronema lutheri TaxID=2081491 RepID=A0A8J5XCK8_DIALT|nr:hypothetical protein KFE25_002362 [Diacronema lutheri]